MPVVVRRIEDDVTKTSDVTEAGPGDTITYTVEVAPNVTREDLTYSITDTLPAGTTYVDGSATDGATYADGKVTWNADLPSTYGEQGTYDITSSKTDTSCVNPFSGKADYTDLLTATGGALKADPAISGDSKLWNAFTSTDLGLYGEAFRGVGYTDDGFLVYGGADNWAQTNDDEPWVPQVLPNPALPNNLAAGMWRDGQVFYNAAANSGVTTRPDGLRPEDHRVGQPRWLERAGRLPRHAGLPAGGQQRPGVGLRRHQGRPVGGDRRHGERRRHQRRRRWSTSPTRPRRSPTGPSCA